MVKDKTYLWRVEDLAQAPHESTVDPHELLQVHAVGLVQHHPDLVLAPLEDLIRAREGGTSHVRAARTISVWTIRRGRTNFDNRGEFIGYVEFEGVEEQDDHVRPLREPPNMCDVRKAQHHSIIASQHHMRT